MKGEEEAKGENEAGWAFEGKGPRRQNSFGWVSRERNNNGRGNGKKEGLGGLGKKK